MFKVGFSELFIVLFIAFLVLGPKDLSKVARSLARFIKFLNANWAASLEKKKTEMDSTVKEFHATGDEVKRQRAVFVPCQAVSYPGRSRRRGDSDPAGRRVSGPDPLAVACSVRAERAGRASCAEEGNG